MQNKEPLTPKSDVSRRFLEAMEAVGITGYRLRQEGIIPAQSTLTRIRNGRQDPSRQAVQIFCDKYGVSIGWIYSGCGEMMNNNVNATHNANGADISMINKDNSHHNNLNVTSQEEGVTSDETSFLKEKIRMLEKTVKDKDQEIAFLREMLSKQITSHTQQNEAI